MRVPRSPTMPAPVGRPTLAVSPETREKGLAMHDPLTPESQVDTHARLSDIFGPTDNSFGEVPIYGRNMPDDSGRPPCLVIVDESAGAFFVMSTSN